MLGPKGGGRFCPVGREQQMPPHAMEKKRREKSFSDGHSLCREFLCVFPQRSHQVPKAPSCAMLSTSGSVAKVVSPSTTLFGFGSALVLSSLCSLQPCNVYSCHPVHARHVVFGLRSIFASKKAICCCSVVLNHMLTFCTTEN